MANMVIRGNEFIRISPKDNKQLEYSTNQGRTWSTRIPSWNTGGKLAISDLMENGAELLATTEKGLYYSTNEGRTWTRRS